MVVTEIEDTEKGGVFFLMCLKIKQQHTKCLKVKHHSE